MPILPAEPDLYPSDLWDRLSEPVPEPQDDEARVRWMCLHTRPRQEKAVARRRNATRQERWEGDARDRGADDAT